MQGTVSTKKSGRARYSTDHSMHAAPRLRKTHKEYAESVESAERRSLSVSPRSTPEIVTISGARCSCKLHEMKRVKYIGYGRPHEERCPSEVEENRLGIFKAYKRMQRYQVWVGKPRFIFGSLSCTGTMIRV